VPYGAIYYQNWYRDEKETQGLFLQKATHDFDYIGHLLGRTPVQVCAMSSKQIFKGHRPAGLRCVDCAENETCLESAVLKRRRGEEVQGEYCCFAVDTGNEDSGSALIRYDSGMHVSYSQNFFARRGAQARGARLLGYRGTLEFDFYTGILRVHMHHGSREETYDLGGDGAHFGGDAALVGNFMEVARAGAPSQYPLEAGCLSALLCLRARDSARDGAFKTVSWGWL
jgi:predicted dehydrogenase